MMSLARQQKPTGRWPPGLRAVLSRVLAYSGLLALWRRAARRGVPTVVYFHEVAPGSRTGGIPVHASLRIEPTLFEWVLSHLGQRYQFADLDEAVASADPRLVAVTFDDGYRGVYQHAFPVLRRRNIPATVFLMTDYVGASRAPWWDRLLLQVRAGREQGGHAARRLGMLEPALLTRDGEVDEDALLVRFKVMSSAQREAVCRVLDDSAGEPVLSERVFLSREEIREMAAAGVRFGAHTRTHPLLSWLGETSLREELAGSLADVTQLTGQGSVWFAYPDGVFGDREVAVAREVGFRGAVQTWQQPWRRGPFAVPRVAMNGGNVCEGGTQPQPARLEVALAGLSSVAIRSLWRAERGRSHE